MKTEDSMDKLFNYYILDLFCKKYNITKDIAINSPAINFRLLCFRMNYFMKSIILPKFKKTSLYEAEYSLTPAGLGAQLRWLGRQDQFQ